MQTYKKTILMCNYSCWFHVILIDERGPSFLGAIKEHKIHLGHVIKIENLPIFSEYQTIIYVLIECEITKTFY